MLTSSSNPSLGVLLRNSGFGFNALMIPSSNNSSSGSRNVLLLRWPADGGTPVGGLHHPGQPRPEPGQGGRELRKRKT